MKNYTKWYKNFKPKPEAKIRLFCFHHSGGGASSYYRWLEHISPNIELIAIQLPGREDRFCEPVMSCLEDIIAELSEGFWAYKEKPFYVFGHSLGALVGFEFVKAIRKVYSISPCYLVISAARAPHLIPCRLPLSQLDDETLIEKLKVYDGIDEHILNHRELLNLFLPSLRSDFYLLEKYQYNSSQPFRCDILTMAGSHDKTVSDEDLHAWSAYTKGKFTYLSFPGSHFFIKNHQKRILQIINQIGENILNVQKSKGELVFS